MFPKKNSLPDRQANRVVARQGGISDTAVFPPADANMQLCEIASRQKLHQVMVSHFLPLLAADHYAIYAGVEDGIFLHDTAYVLSHGVLAAILRQQQQLAKESNDLSFVHGAPFIIDIKQHVGANKKHELYALHQNGTKEILAIRLLHQQQGFATLLLFSSGAGIFRKKTLPLLREATVLLSAALYNVMATEKKDQPFLFDGHEAGQTKEARDNKTETVCDLTAVIGDSEEMEKVRSLVLLVAPTDSTVLLSGETGTGKEVIASAIHAHSRRLKNPIVKLNCAALPAHLVESELFGHEKGSFTGAIEKRIGKFELADAGTLFLDEIGELPLSLQAKLLRALQEKEIERIGGNRTIKIDVRIIAASNRDLLQEVREGRFREDLYYRLNIFPLHLPPLRNRIGDIPVLAKHFAAQFNSGRSESPTTFSDGVLSEMMAYSWPGNIRELIHFIERTVLMAKSARITRIELPRNPIKIPGKRQIDELQIRPLHEVERDYIIKVVNHCNGRISGPKGAAKLLEIPATTLISKMQKLGIKKNLKSD